MTVKNPSLKVSIRNMKALAAAIMTLIFALQSFSTPGIRSIPSKSAMPIAEEIPERIMINKLHKKSKDPWLEQFIRMFAQADAVAREVEWVLSGKRKEIGFSPFGRVGRALEQVDQRKQSKLRGLDCDRYSIEGNWKKGNQGFRFSVYTTCRISEKNKLAEISGQSQEAVEVIFTSLNLADSLGLSSSIYGKNLLCRLRSGPKDGQVSIDSKAILDLQSLQCELWLFDRGKQLVVLDSLIYQKELATRTQVRNESSGSLELKGKVLENLQAVSTVNAKVPMTGKIMVTEEEIAKPTPQPAHQAIQPNIPPMTTPAPLHPVPPPQLIAPAPVSSGGVRLRGHRPGMGPPLPEPEYSEQDPESPDQNEQGNPNDPGGLQIPPESQR